MGKEHVLGGFTVKPNNQVKFGEETDLINDFYGSKIKGKDSIK